MEVKKSKVMSVQANGSWEGNYGVMYKFEIVFQNGDVGEYSSKSQAQNKFEQGAETEYEYHGGKFPKIKPHYSKPQGGFSGGGAKSFGKSDDVQQKIVRQSMIKASIDFWAMNSEMKPDVENVLRVATKFIDFVNQEDKTQFSEEFKKQEAMIDRGEKTNDLPF